MSASNRHPNGPTPFWVTRRGARVALIAAHLAAAAVLLAELIHPLSRDGHDVERVPALEFFGSYALYGFVGCCVLVLLGRVLRRLVMRDERYYGEDR